jgi:hypothetical protein
MALTFLKEAFRYFKVDPFFWLFRKVVFLRDLDFSVAENISKELTSAASVFGDKT